MVSECVFLSCHHILWFCFEAWDVNGRQLPNFLLTCLLSHWEAKCFAPQVCHWLWQYWSQLVNNGNMGSKRIFFWKSSVQCSSFFLASLQIVGTLLARIVTAVRVVWLFAVVEEGATNADCSFWTVKGCSCSSLPSPHPQPARVGGGTVSVLPFITSKCYQIFVWRRSFNSDTNDHLMWISVQTIQVYLVNCVSIQIFS